MPKSRKSEGKLVRRSCGAVAAHMMLLERFPSFRTSQMRLEGVTNGTTHGLRLTFEDQGPGIADIGLAMRDGYTSGTGLGLGLSGSRRLCQEFAITSTPGVGTRVVIARWK